MMLNRMIYPEDSSIVEISDIDGDHLMQKYLVSKFTCTRKVCLLWNSHLGTALLSRKKGLYQSSLFWQNPFVQTLVCFGFRSHLF